MRKIIPFAVGVAAIVALVLAVNPRSLGGVIEHFDVRALPVIVALSMTYYLLQGLRWHYLLRVVGVRLRLGDTVLLNMAGQSTGLLPLGELTRAILVTDAAEAEFGAVVATITVQELTYTLIIIAAAVPGALQHPQTTGGLLFALFLTSLVFVILLVPPVFRLVRAVVRRTPLLGRYLADVDELQRETVVLLRRWDTLALSAISISGALDAITLFWLVVHSLQPGLVSWPVAAFIYAVSHIVGAITFSPGGLGGFEASTVGLLISVGGADPALAGGCAILQRVADKGLATLVGMVAYLIARRRFRLGGISLLRPREAQERSRRARRRPKEATAG
ncbi:MAG: flippase-like domain-containing protein [Chloroflexi bacterium]|nr:MAG: flippase-like domain-containing protein [Chloroflexota bacterium]